MSQRIYFSSLPTLKPGESIRIQDYIRTTGTTSIASINIRDNSSGGGYFEINGQIIPSGKTIDFHANSSWISGDYDFLLTDIADLRFVAGNSSASDSLVINGNFGSGLVGSSYGTIRTDAPVTISEPGSLSISTVSSSVVSEGTNKTTKVTFNIERTGGTDGDVSVNWSIQHGSTNSRDFNGSTSDTVTIRDGDDSTDISVYLNTDSEQESNETFSVVLSNASGGASLQQSTASVTIIDDDLAPVTLPGSLSISADQGYMVTEGTDGYSYVTFTVSRNGGTDGAVSADWAIQHGGTNALDFLSATTGTVDFQDGQSSDQIRIQISPDSEVESNESFSVRISNPKGGANISQSTAYVQISNDDIEVIEPSKPGTLSITADQGSSIIEGSTGSVKAVTFTISRDGGTDGKVSANWSVQHIGTNSQDFLNVTSGNVEFEDGQSTKQIQVLVASDQNVEPNENFVVRISDPTGGANISQSTAIVQIANDDTAAEVVRNPGVISVASMFGTSVEEGTYASTTLTFEVEREKGTDGDVSVDWIIDHGTTNSSDFRGATSGTINIPDGEDRATVSVSINGDSEEESNERFSLILRNPSGGATLGLSTANATIKDDDETVAADAISEFLALLENGSPENAKDRTEFWELLKSIGAASIEPVSEGFLEDALKDAYRYSEVNVSRVFFQFDNSTYRSLKIDLTDVFEATDYLKHASILEKVGSWAAGAGDVLGHLERLTDDARQAIESESGLEAFIEMSESALLTIGGIKLGMAVAGMVALAPLSPVIGAAAVIAAVGTTGYFYAKGADVIDDQNIPQKVLEGIKNLYASVSSANVLEGIENSTPSTGAGSLDAITWSSFQRMDKISDEIATHESGDAGRNRLKGDSDGNLIESLDGNDVIRGRGGSDVLVGGNGRDKLLGGSGADVLLGSAGHDKVIGNRGKDFLFGESGRDKLKGGSGSDILEGGAARDRLTGGSGHDTLNGGDGNDVLIGNGGRDLFIFNSDSGADRITDLNTNQDEILLMGWDGYEIRSIGENLMVLETESGSANFMVSGMVISELEEIITLSSTSSGEF